MRLVLASGNLHKAEEISRMLPDADLRLQSEFDVTPAIESGSTFIENALIKARHACRQTGLPVIADDSGLCVEAMNGAPGIISARYAGETASDRDNVAKLLSELDGENNRNAFFHCVLVLLRSPDDPRPLIAEGTWHGEISRSPKGNQGFGYDPVFFLPSLGRTAAELTQDEKNAISHRGLALQRLAKSLQDEPAA